MNETKQSSHQHGTPARDGVHHHPDPYWKRAHTDWRFWVGFILMFAAITMYVMSDDLALAPRSQLPPLSSGAGK